MSADVVPIRPAITSCSHCDEAVADGHTTMTVTVTRETWRSGEMPSVEVHEGRAALIYCMTCADKLDFNEINVASRASETKPEIAYVPFIDGPWKGQTMHSSMVTLEVEDGSSVIADPLTLSPAGVRRTRYFLQLKADCWVWSVDVPDNANELLAEEAKEVSRLLGDPVSPSGFVATWRSIAHTVQYAASVASHVLTGKLTGRHALLALRTRPLAVASKGKVWVVDPSFQG